MKIYDEICAEFSATRTHVWPPVKQYLDSISENSLVCDIGCGNGKNQYRTDLQYVSIDSSQEMCKLVPGAVQGCVTHLPFDDNMFDSCISIACIHHLDSYDMRRKAVSEIYRVLRPGGTALISMWAAQPKYGTYDCNIKWKTDDKLRYYYMSTKDCITELFEGYSYDVSFEKHNFYVEVYKALKQ